MISLRVNMGMSELLVEQSTISDEVFNLSLTRYGEHQNDPKHRFHKPDVTVTASMRRRQLVELIDGLRRMM